MRIKSQNGKSIASQLSDILCSTLPMVMDTGINSHLGTIKPDAKGKAVLFTWKKNIYRLTEHLKVQERDFTNTFVTTDECKQVEDRINTVLSLVVAPEKVAIPEEKIVVEPVLV